MSNMLTYTLPDSVRCTQIMYKFEENKFVEVARSKLIRPGTRPSVQYIKFNVNEPYVIGYYDGADLRIEILTCYEYFKKTFDKLRSKLNYINYKINNVYTPVPSMEASLSQLIYAELKNAWVELKEGINRYPHGNDYVIIKHTDDTVDVFDPTLLGQSAFPDKIYNDYIQEGKSSKEAVDLIKTTMFI